MARTARPAPPRRPAAKRSTTPEKAWAGRFREPTDPSVEAFSTSIETDLAMAEQDIRGSIAHVHGLRRARLLSAREATTIERGLGRVARELATGTFTVRPSDEDVHMAVERRLTEIVGPVGGKVHTGRSRNDQVATDLRLWLRDEIDATIDDVRRLAGALVGRARTDLGIVVPGYTHLQRAQPVLLSHHWLAHVEMLLRDAERLGDARRRTNVMPLGSGALAGAGFAIDREKVARVQAAFGCGVLISVHTRRATGNSRMATMTAMKVPEIGRLKKMLGLPMPRTSDCWNEASSCGTSTIDSTIGEIGKP